MTAITIHPEIMNSLIKIDSDFQDGCIVLLQEKKIIAEFYKCEWCNEWFEIDNAYRILDGRFCQKECYMEYERCWDELS